MTEDYAANYDARVLLRVLLAVFYLRRIGFEEQSDCRDAGTIAHSVLKWSGERWASARDELVREHLATAAPLRPLGGTWPERVRERSEDARLIFWLVFAKEHGETLHACDVAVQRLGWSSSRMRRTVELLLKKGLLGHAGCSLPKDN